MTDVVFAFGPDGYFFESQTQWRMKYLPQRLTARFASGSTDVAHVYQLVLGSGESWFMSYRTKAGGASFAHDGLPEKLAAWLRVKDANGYSIRDIPRLHLSLGPHNGSFWIEDGREFFWDGLPGPLQLALDKLRSPNGGWSRMPRIVVLGINQSYVMISEGGGGSYAVSDYYPRLEQELVALVRTGKPGALKGIHHISMDQHDGQNFVLTMRKGSVAYHVPDTLKEDVLLIRSTIPYTPNAANTASREAETGSNAMPTPQVVAVPSAVGHLHRSPEEGFNANTLKQSSHATNMVQTQQISSVSIGSPLPPYTPQSHGAAQPLADLNALGGIPINRYPPRVDSPQTTYQHPRVAALETVAHQTRIVSPVPSMSTSLYSQEVQRHNLHEHSGISSIPGTLAGTGQAASGSDGSAQPFPALVSVQHPAEVPTQLHEERSDDTGSEVPAAGLLPRPSPSVRHAGSFTPVSAPVQGLEMKDPLQPANDGAQAETGQPCGVQASMLPSLAPSPPSLPQGEDPSHGQLSVGSNGTSTLPLRATAVAQRATAAPIPVQHSPGPTLSRVDSIAIPMYSTPAAALAAKDQLVLVPVPSRPDVQRSNRYFAQAEASRDLPGAVPFMLPVLAAAPTPSAMGST